MHGAGEATEAPLPPEAAFVSLPGQQVLTLNMDVPEAWLVEAVEAEVCNRQYSAASYRFEYCGVSPIAAACQSQGPGCRKPASSFGHTLHREGSKMRRSCHG